MDIESIVTYLICYAPIATLVGVTSWLVWRDKDKLD